MAHYTRQTLAAYGFFEDARRSNKYTQDALIPFVLPAIAGRAGQIFSAELIAKELEPMFGPSLVIHLAESLVEPLARAGYLKRELGGPSGSLYLYDNKTNEIPISATVSRAEEDIRTITRALKEYMTESRLLKPVVITDEKLTTDFVNWITSADAPRLPGTAPEGDHAAAPLDATPKGDQRMEILFSSFVTWTERDRPTLFEKIKLFAELGLIVDLVSEIRVPTTKRKKSVDLAVVLDSTVLLELLGLCGPMLQRSAARLIEICREYKIGLWTLSHLVDEINEICYNVLKNPSEGYADSVNDSVKRYPEVIELVRRVNRAPDTAIKSLGINITPYTNLKDAASARLFNNDDIKDFTAFLEYNPSKPMMAKRDAWSLAYAVRRQSGIHTSNLYESRCVVVTRSPVFARKARQYLRSKTELYPGYAVTPVMELRHFSTMFMLAFGSDSAEKVVRAELVASCEKIVRASPGLLTKVRAVLERMNEFTEAQLDAALADPVTIAEFAVATGNDPSVVTSQAGQALIDIVRGTGAKEERLKSLERERQLIEENQRILDEGQTAARRAVEIAEAARDEAAAARDEAARKGAEESQRAHVLGQEADMAATILANDILRQVRLISTAVWALGVLATAGLLLDMFKDYTNLPPKARIVILVPVAIFVVYHALSFVWPGIEPAVIRAGLTRKLAERRLTSVTSLDLRTRVWEKLPISLLQRPPDDLRS
jgi:hypothetical protein